MDMLAKKCAALYRVNKEAKLVRDVHNDLREFLFEDADVSAELKAFGIANYLYFESILFGFDAFLPEVSLDDAGDLIATTIYNLDLQTSEEIEEAEDELWDEWHEDSRMLDSLHTQFRYLKRYKNALYNLKTECLKQFHLPLAAINKNILDGKLYAYYEYKQYGFHSPLFIGSEDIENPDFFKKFKGDKQVLEYLETKKRIEEVELRSEKDISEDKSLGFSLDEALETLEEVAEDAVEKVRNKRLKMYC